MHGEMNAFAEKAATFVECDMYEGKATKPAMPAMSGKPQNVYATTL